MHLQKKVQTTVVCSSEIKQHVLPPCRHNLLPKDYKRYGIVQERDNLVLTV